MEIEIEDFAEFKPYFLLLYGAIGVFYLALAIWPRRPPSSQVSGAAWAWMLAAGLMIMAGGLLLAKFALSGDYMLLAAAAIGTAIFAVRPVARKRPATIALAASVVTLVLSLAWWLMAPERSGTDTVHAYPLMGFAAILILLTVGFVDPGARSGPLGIAAASAVFLLAGLLLLGEDSTYPVGDFNLMHWEAFSAPALDLRAGLIPFYDIPLQYGLGPTLAIAGACGATNCWVGMEIFVIVMVLANSLLILQMALATTVQRGWLWRGAVIVVIFAATFLWPTHAFSLLAFPSISGVRFLPVTLVAFLLFVGRSAAAAAALVVTLLWSPEAAGMSLAVFGLCETARRGLVRAALLSTALLGGSYAALVLVHRAIFGVWIDPIAVVEYVLHVPGPLPIDPFSNVLLLAAVLGLGGWLMARSNPDPTGARRDRTIIALLFATVAYYLGRSHPNNINNLMPFVVLVALRALDRPMSERSVVARLTAFGLAASVGTLATAYWPWKPYDPNKAFDIRPFIARYPSMEPDFEEIRSRIENPGHLGVANFGNSYRRDPSESIIWTPVDPASIFYFMPPERRQLYIRRSAARLRRSGWAVFAEEQLDLLDDLRAGYTVARQFSVEQGLAADGRPAHYTVVCFDPQPDLAPTHVGPACPAEGS